MSEWISVKDLLPEAEKNVLICEAKFGLRYPSVGMGWICSEINKWCSITDDGVIMNCENNPDYYFITHWMPLPEPPTINNKNHE